MRILQVKEWTEKGRKPYNPGAIYGAHRDGIGGRRHCRYDFEVISLGHFDIDLCSSHGCLIGAMVDSRGRRKKRLWQEEMESFLLVIGIVFLGSEKFYY